MFKVKKMLFYVNNSVGLGHTSRTLSIIKGLKMVDSSIDYLVVCGTDIPQVFMLLMSQYNHLVLNNKNELNQNDIFYARFLSHIQNYLNYQGMCRNQFYL